MRLNRIPTLAAVLTITPLAAVAQTSTQTGFEVELTKRLNSASKLFKKFVDDGTGTSALAPAGLQLQDARLTGDVVQVGEATFTPEPQPVAGAIATYKIDNRCGKLPAVGTLSQSYTTGTNSTSTSTEAKSLSIKNKLEVKASWGTVSAKNTLTTDYNTTSSSGSSESKSLSQTSSVTAQYRVMPGKAQQLALTNSYFELKDKDVTYQLKPQGSVGATLAGKAVDGKSAWTYDGTYGVSTTALQGWVELGNVSGKTAKACATVYNGKTYIGTVDSNACAVDIDVGDNKVKKQGTYTSVWVHPALQWESDWTKKDDSKHVASGGQYPSRADGLVCVDKNGRFGWTSSRGCETSTDGGSDYKLLRYASLQAVQTAALEQADASAMVVPVAMKITASVSKVDATQTTSDYIPTDAASCSSTAMAAPVLIQSDNRRAVP